MFFILSSCPSILNKQVHPIRIKGAILFCSFYPYRVDFTLDLLSIIPEVTLRVNRFPPIEAAHI